MERKRCIDLLFATVLTRIKFDRNSMEKNKISMVRF